MSAFIARVKVVASAAVTWLVAASAVVTIAAEEIAEVVAADDAEKVTRIALRVTAVLGAAVAIIRRSTPVLDKADRGLLPNEG